MEFLELQFFNSVFSREGDPRMKNYVLLQSPLYPLTLTILYLVFVLKIGPHFMEKRKPFSLKTTVTIYNITQIVTNGYLLAKMSRAIFDFSILCSPVDTSNSAHALLVVRMHHFYNLLKLYDFVETVIYVFRKKQNQVSFLHLYHHVGLYLSTWFSAKYFPGGQPCIAAFLNCCVHVVMYVYYLISSWTDSKYVWWKKYVTALQIAQHYVIFLTFFLPLVNPYCSYSKGFLLFYVIFMATMIYLFITFYKTSYSNKKEKK